MTATQVKVSAEWLTLRERADAEARATDLVEGLVPHLPAGDRVIHDLGSGSGSMARWLAPRLCGAQHWILHDRDAELLEVAVADPPAAAADGAPVTVEARPGDIAELGPRGLTGASLVTASALLDMMTAAELGRLVETCSGAGCPVLIALSVIGEVELAPEDPFDSSVAAAFNEHQRRLSNGAPLLGPDAVAAAVAGFTDRGMDVVVSPSPWRLGAGQTELVAEWFAGWLGAACEQRPELRTEAAAYARRRAAEATAGELTVTVHHEDLLALPR